MEDITDKYPCVVLTSTVKVDSTPFVERSAAHLRLNDYKDALSQWIANPYVTRIVFVENSGYDVSPLKELTEHKKLGTKEIELISFVAEPYPKHLGKGYGETLALREAVNVSRLLAITGKFVKVSGRYYVPNIRPILERVANGIDLVCDFRRNLTWSDGRVFGGSVEFLRDYVCREGLRVNDTGGIYFEHALARAAHRAIADGMRWSLLPCPPTVIGVSASSNQTYHTLWHHRKMQALFHRAKSLVLSR